MLPVAETTTSPMASTMVVTSVSCSDNTCKRWRPPCTFCAQFSPTPLTSRFWLVRRGLGWRHRKRKEKRKTKKEEKILNYYPPGPIYDPHSVEVILPHLTPQQKIELDPNYYPWNYIPELEDALTLVNILIPGPTPERRRNRIQNVKEDKIVEDRRIVVEVRDKEDDLNYYSNSDYTYQSYV